MELSFNGPHSYPGFTSGATILSSLTGLEILVCPIPTPDSHPGLLSCIPSGLKMEHRLIVRSRFRPI
jgi:hypothetical protein